MLRNIDSTDSFMQHKINTRWMLVEQFWLIRMSTMRMTQKCVKFREWHSCFMTISFPFLATKKNEKKQLFGPPYCVHLHVLSFVKCLMIQSIILIWVMPYMIEKQLSNSTSRRLEVFFRVFPSKPYNIKQIK